MVDWSAAAVPRTGADSIWWALHRVGAPSPERLENPATREAAMAALAELFAAEAAAGRRVLAGFDFPFGYPQGAAAAMAGAPSWAALWAAWADGLSDAADNANDRFAFAEALNARVWDGAGPFWGRPPKPDRPALPARKPSGYGARYPAERRAVEARVPRAQPCWKLFTTGSVGGQALLGIARLERLRRLLGPRAQVWPFETGWSAGAAPILLAEIYPSLLPPDPREPVKDAGQVRAVAARLAALGAAGRLDPLFARPPDLDDDRAALREEAWILGVGREPLLRGEA